MQKTVFKTPDTLDCKQAFKEVVKEQRQSYEPPRARIFRQDGLGRTPDTEQSGGDQ